MKNVILSKIAHEDTENYHQREGKCSHFLLHHQDRKRRDEKFQFFKVIKNVVDELSKGWFSGDSMKVLQVHVVKTMKVHKAHSVIIINSKTHIHMRSHEIVK